MGQCHPDNICNPGSPKFRECHREIARPPSKEEISRSFSYAKGLGLNFQALSYEKSPTGSKYEFTLTNSIDAAFLVNGMDRTYCDAYLLSL